MITCPRCGTQYQEFQFNCENCGESLPLPPDDGPEPEEMPAVSDVPLTPPLPPRQIPKKVMVRMLFNDPVAIIAGIFFLIGSVFFLVATMLLTPIIKLPASLPFTGLDIIFLIVGGIVFFWRYKMARQTVDILQNGQAAMGEITNLAQNYHVRVNNRHPWVIQYQFKVLGQSYQGKLSTLGQPDLSEGPGTPIYVLYKQDDPQKSTIYPSPFGY